MEKKVAVYSLGCKVNQYEAEAVLEEFAENGFSRVDFDDYSDVYVINTCTVTGLGDRKSRQIIRRAKQKNPEAVLVVMGCYAQTASEEILKIPEVDIVIGTGGRGKIVEEVRKFSENKNRRSLVSDIFAEKCFEEQHITGYRGKTARAFLKVQDGCNRYCSYCIIPYARGNIRSRELENSVNEARRLAESGYSEIVLVGIHLASYGIEKKDLSLIDLIQNVTKIDKIKRVRLGSLEPTIFTDDFIEKLSAEKKICHHFHISLQSGCDETLKRMNRRYSAADFAAAVERIRAKMPGCAITTDILTGFPGETEEEFEKTCDFVSKIQFSDAHVFKYSPRKGTKAAVMENQVAPGEKDRRSKILIDITKKSRDEFLNKMIGKTFEVLFEEETEDGKLEGKTDTYVSVCAAGNSSDVGMIKKVKAERAQGALLLGKQE